MSKIFVLQQSSHFHGHITLDYRQRKFGSRRFHTQRSGVRHLRSDKSHVDCKGTHGEMDYVNARRETRRKGGDPAVARCHSCLLLHNSLNFTG